MTKQDKHFGIISAPVNEKVALSAHRLTSRFQDALRGHYSMTTVVNDMRQQADAIGNTEQFKRFMLTHAYSPVEDRLQLTRKLFLILTTPGVTL